MPRKLIDFELDFMIKDIFQQQWDAEQEYLKTDM